MADLYANENLPAPVVQELRALGHDVLTSCEAGNANQKIPDDQVLAFATSRNRAVVTLNRQDFIQLHRQNSNHGGIIACTTDLDFRALARRIDSQIQTNHPLRSRLLRVNREKQP